MMRDVIVINRDDASRACAKAINDLTNKLKTEKFEADFIAMRMMELTVFSAMIVSALFEDQKLKWEDKE